MFQLPGKKFGNKMLGNRASLVVTSEGLKNVGPLIDLLIFPLAVEQLFDTWLLR